MFISTNHSTYHLSSMSEAYVTVHQPDNMEI